jgi:hypothetical protein
MAFLPALSAELCTCWGVGDQIMMKAHRLAAGGKRMACSLRKRFCKGPLREDTARNQIDHSPNYCTGSNRSFNKQAALAHRERVPAPEAFRRLKEGFCSLMSGH